MIGSRPAWRLGRRVGLAWRVLRAEGPVAFRDRLLDRMAARRRRRSFRTLAPESLADQPITGIPVLNVLATPPRPDLGGVQVQFLRRLEAEAEHRSWALLYPQGGGYRLEIDRRGERRALALEAPAPAPHPALADRSFESVVRRAAALVGAGAVHFEQLLGWPLESILRLRNAGLRLVLSVHDFGLFCPRPHLLERPMMRFCHYSRDSDRCCRCLACDWDVDAAFQHRRRGVARELLRAAEAVIFPSRFLRRTYRQLMPESASDRHFVIEPPSLGASTSPGVAPRPGGRHVAYIGSVQPHKGALLFEQLVDRMAQPRLPGLRWSVYGGGDFEILRRLRKKPAVRVRGYYRAEELPGLLRRDRVDVALVLSIWPEAYALTFDECLRSGVPVVAFDHGAVADRLRRIGGGELVSLEAGVEGVAQRLRRMLEKPPSPAEIGFQLPDAVGAARAVLGIYRDLGFTDS